MDQREKKLVAYLEDGNDGNFLHFLFWGILWSVLLASLFEILMTKFWYRLEFTEKFLTMAWLSSLFAAVFICGRCSLRCAIIAYNRRRMMEKMRAEGTLEEVLKDFEASVPNPDPLLSLVTGMRAGERYLYKKGADLDFADMGWVPHFRRGSLKYGRAWPLPYSEIARILWKDDTLWAVLKDGSSVLLGDLWKPVDSSATSDIRKFLQEKNPEITK